MKEYVEVKATFKEKLLFLLLGVISKSVITDKPKICEFHDLPKREKGATYTHYPKTQDSGHGVLPDNPWPRSNVPPPPAPPPIRVIREGVFINEKMPDIPFFELDNGTTKSNL